MSTEIHPTTGPHRLRTSDSEREEVATILRAAMGEGRLSLTEGEERLAAAYAARFRDELAPLTADLPDGGRGALPATPQARARARRVTRWRIAAAALFVLLVAALAALPGDRPWHLVPLIVLLVLVHRHVAWHRRTRHRHPAWHGGHRDTPAPWNR